MRWLAGKTHELAEYDFGYYDMGLTLTAMEEAFEAIVQDGELMFDEDFMMNIFSGIADKVDPFQAYLHFMSEEKMSDAPSRNDDDKVYPWDLIRAAVFYPSHADILETHNVGCIFNVIAGVTFLREF